MKYVLEFNQIADTAEEMDAAIKRSCLDFFGDRKFIVSEPVSVDAETVDVSSVGASDSALGRRTAHVIAVSKGVTLA